jgi:LppX_LprAFG lipoprotein
MTRLGDQLDFVLRRIYKRNVSISRLTARRIGLALLALGAAVGLAGCAFSKTIDPVAAAATKTEQAGGVQMAMTVTLTGRGQTSTITANGAFDREQGELTLDASGLLQSAGLPAGSGSGIKLLYLQEGGDPVTYVQLPFLANRLPSGESWIKLDLETVGQSFGVDVNQLLGQATQNPGQALDLLRASGDVQEVGTATVDGVATTEYQATIDLAKAAQLGGLPQAQIQKLTASGAPTTLPVDVWIGPDGLVRKLDLTESTTSAGLPASVDVTVDLSDYGTPVTVTAPPADQVFDASSLLAGLASKH